MTMSDRRRHVDAWRASGLSREDYCAQHGIVPSTLLRWVRGYVHLVDRTPKPLTKISLMPVKIEAAPSSLVSAQTLELRSPSGFTWSFGVGMDPGRLADLIRRIG